MGRRSTAGKFIGAILQQPCDFFVFSGCTTPDHLLKTRPDWSHSTHITLENPCYPHQPSTGILPTIHRLRQRICAQPASPPHHHNSTINDTRNLHHVKDKQPNQSTVAKISPTPQERGARVENPPRQ
jgi:hypothetical protein